MSGLTQDRLRHLLHYDPDTGVFIRLVALCNRVKVGDVAGGNNGDGYVKIRVDGKLYFAHCLAWLYMVGQWPSHEVDHRDTDRANNRWANLRATDDEANSQNRRKAHSNSKSGLLGVSWETRGKVWVAQIMVKGKNHRLGRFTTPEEAHQAYLTAKRVMHAGCTI